MSEILSLFPALFLVYVLQCIVAAPPASVVFYLNHRLRGRLLHHSWRVGRSQHKLFFVNPFLPFVGALHVHPLPLTFRCNTQGEPLGFEFVSSRNPGAGVELISFVEQRNIGFRAKEILIDGEPRFSLHSEAAAKRVALFLKRAQDSPQKKRWAVLEREFHRMLSTKSLKDRLQQYSRSTASLHASCFSLFLFVFLFAPLLVFFLGLHRMWFVLLVYLLLSSCTILWLFRRSHLELYPGKSDAYLQQMFTIALSPFAAIRANDSLLPDLLSEFHPLAVAQQILPEEELLTFAGNEMRKAKFLSQDSVLLLFLTDFLTGHRMDVKSLLRPPIQDNPRSRSFCPVCLTQFVIDVGECRDCNGVSLHSFAAKATEVSNTT